MNRLIKVVVVGISKHLDKSTVREKKIEPYRKIWIEGDMKMLMEEVYMLQRERKRELGNKGKENWKSCRSSIGLRVKAYWL